MWPVWQSIYTETWFDEASCNAQWQETIFNTQLKKNNTLMWPQTIVIFSDHLDVTNNSINYQCVSLQIHFLVSANMFICCLLRSVYHWSKANVKRFLVPAKCSCGQISFVVMFVCSQGVQSDFIGLSPWRPRTHIISRTEMDNSAMTEESSSFQASQMNKTPDVLQEIFA